MRVNVSFHSIGDRLRLRGSGRQGLRSGCTQDTRLQYVDQVPYMISTGDKCFLTEYRSSFIRHD